MGWFYENPGATRRDLIQRLSRDSVWRGRDGKEVTLHVLRKSCSGNVLWTVEERYLDGELDVEPHIKCYLLQRNGDTWGYKPMNESCGPRYFTCPLSYLERCRVVNQEWRSNVIRYWVKRNEKVRL